MFISQVDIAIAAHDKAEETACCSSASEKVEEKICEEAVVEVVKEPVKEPVKEQLTAKQLAELRVLEFMK